MTLVSGPENPDVSSTLGGSGTDDNWLRAAGSQLRVPPAGWRALSACASADHGLFVGDISPYQEARAKEICERCQVQDACLAFSITHGVQSGVWGGLNGRERRKVRQVWMEQREMGVAGEAQQPA